MADGMLIRLAEVLQVLGMEHCHAGQSVEAGLPWEVLKISRTYYVWRDKVAVWMLENGGVTTLEEAHERLRGAMIKARPRKRKQVALPA